MANLVSLPTYRDQRGALTVIEKILPFAVQRVYYIHSCADVVRGGHRHLVTKQALVCVHGSCVVDWDDGAHTGSAVLDSPETLLVLDPQDWHVMRAFSPDAVLLVLASHHFDKDDYVEEAYRHD